MNFKNLIFNDYVIKARIYPAFLLIAPVVILGIEFFSVKLAFIQFMLPIFILCGGTFLLAQLARDFGKKKEKNTLQPKWGGVPSILLLRHSDTTLDSITKKRYHTHLARWVTGTSPPTPEQEKLDPETADEVYLAWTNYLRHHTRDTMVFRLLNDENTNYGYRRNIWGLRPYGICSSLLIFLGSGAQFYFVHLSSHPNMSSIEVLYLFSQVDKSLIATGVLSLIMLVLWTFCFSVNWVKVAADAYAKRLVESVDTLSKQQRN